LLLSCAALLSAPFQSRAQTSAGASAHEYRVLLAGNSLITTNNLPALLRALGTSQGTPISTETYAAPGGTLAERWEDGHLQEALQNRKFDAVILQEQGGKVAACMATPENRKAPCAASLRAYGKAFALARAGGAKTFIFTTWGPDDRWQGRLNRSAHLIADKTSATVFNAAGMLEALAKADPKANLLVEGTHPTPRASLMIAVALYRDITGTTPIAKDLRVTAPLLPQNADISPDSAMETQAGLAGDGKATVIPASLIEPLIRALPAEDSGEMRPSRRGR
jgi:hypothetical protein